MSSERAKARRGLALVAPALLGSACDGPPRCARSEPAENVLIVVSDDIGIDKTGTYGEHPTAPATPNLDALAAEGLLFRAAYATPTCSPTRAALLTGRYPSRTGIGRWIEPGEDEHSLPRAELTLAEMLRHAPRCTTTALVGKWHLVSFLGEDPADDPRAQGFDHHAGSLANLANAVRDHDDALSYTRWEKATDGRLSWSDAYAPRETTDDALAFLATAPEPWALIVAYNLAHTPLTAPPGELDLLGVDAGSSDQARYAAMVMAMDAELGRLLDGLDPEQRARTTIVYLSDNGTPPERIEAPWTPGRGKGTIYDGGVRVPLIVAGPRVATPGAETSALAHVVDLFPTVAEIAGVELADLQVEEGEDAGAPLEIDGTSLLPLLEDPDAPPPRETVFTEGFYPNGDGAHESRQRMIRDATHKLVRKELGDQPAEERLYRYRTDQLDEGYDLLGGALSAEDAAAWERLGAALDALTAELDGG